jgi:H+/Cl- antiporter ClcA
MIHIHSPSSPDSATRWGARSLISLMLSTLARVAGPEGAAIEATHALAMKWRTRSSRWFEQKRRTDAAAALAAGISAAFGAPFAGVLLPIEMEIGGRIRVTAVAALTAFLVSRLLGNMLSVPAFDLSGVLQGFQFTNWREWLGILAIGGFGGFAGAGSIRFIRYTQDSLLEIFRTRTWIRTLAGGIMLFLVAMVYRSGQDSASYLLEQVLWSRRGTQEVALLFCVHLLSLSLVLSAFGTAGLFWPVFALGGYLGFGVDQLVSGQITGFTAVSGLAGGAAFFGAVLDAPLTGALIAFELTRDIHVLLPCLIAGTLAHYLRRRVLRTRSLIELDLAARGMALVEGRSSSVLDAVFVKEAMVSDHEIVHEQEPVSALHSRILKSRYPFLPVVTAQGVFRGLLTIDMIQEGWQSQETPTSNSPLSNLLEAKDLLYRAGTKTPTVKVNDKLSVTSGLFDAIPCVPVLADDGRVVGLLFVHNVRLAYDREVARRSLSFGSGEA